MDFTLSCVWRPAAPQVKQRLCFLALNEMLNGHNEWLNLLLHELDPHKTACLLAARYSCSVPTRNVNYMNQDELALLCVHSLLVKGALHGRPLDEKLINPWFQIPLAQGFDTNAPWPEKTQQQPFFVLARLLSHVSRELFEYPADPF